MLIGFLKPLEWALPASDKDLPTLEGADAVDSLRRAVRSLTHTFGLNKRVTAEPSEVPEIDPEVISVLEWAAKELRPQEAPEPATPQSAIRQRQQDGLEPAARAIGVMHDLLKTTKRLPTLKEIAELLEVSDRTLRGATYKAFHKAWTIERNSRRCKHHAKAEKRK